MKKDVVIAGVGGQGSLFATNVLCQFAMEKGFQVLGTETIGAAQRGGAVVSHMRISDAPIYSPLVPAGSADILIGMEAIELLRNLSLLGKEGYYILNLFQIPTVYTNLGIDPYLTFQEIGEAIKRAGIRGHEIRATQKAAELGSPQMTNVVMLGALCSVEEFFSKGEIRPLVESLSPKKYRSKNLEAFDAGSEQARPA
ncbi:MAG: pyruvate ferredoxin oxidoreductase [Deltaproteobacteria bacterium HGW-Deltaproteobacteria-21]|jgi:indolepyruvate ferredoxin oxidoreductase beta subunit|nr:MAG: pyruvate ferredoxin oxidoreductase [Deltaproteobacteria bacterium HGW-Deltaproteobacteria-21]